MDHNPLVEQVGASDQSRLCRWRFLDWLCKLCHILFKRPKRGDPCVYIPERIINRPDPCIYDQFLLMKLDQPVTWDNPDVALFLNGVEQYTYGLTVSTTYEVVITVHNSSRDKRADGTLVDVRWIEFGAGGQIRHHITTLTANVPVWPGVTQVQTVWKTPASPGHYCIEVELSHPEDGNPSNNLGWNNTQVLAAASQVQTPVRIFNRWPDGCPPVQEGGGETNLVRVFAGWAVLGAVWGLAASVRIGHHDFSIRRAGLWFVTGYFFSALVGYLIEALRARGRQGHPNDPPPRDRTSCLLVELFVDSYVFRDAVGKDADPNAMFAPRPPAWPARVEPHLFHFAPNEAYRDVLLIVDAPDQPGPPEVFNVNAFQGGMPAGGVTVTIKRKEEG
jgi:hypothetical protein